MLLRSIQIISSRWNFELSTLLMHSPSNWGRNHGCDNSLCNCPLPKALVKIYMLVPFIWIGKCPYWFPLLGKKKKMKEGKKLERNFNAHLSLYPILTFLCFCLIITRLYSCLLNLQHKEVGPNL